ncbi:MAG TPA: GvpL/GvpF family gas vesicle protein [Ktedonobacterales bacterium]
MNEARSQSAGSYLYCVAYLRPLGEGGSSLQLTGVDGNPVRVISQGDLAAVVSDAQTEQYDVTLENVRAHEAVVEAVMQRSDVLPVSFGTVASSDQEIQQRLLQLEADELRSQLESVKGRVEMGVKALWQQDALFAHLVAKYSDIQELREQIVGTTPEETYDLRMELGELTDQAIQREREEDAAAILDALSPLALATQTNKLITDMMIVNAAFLVDKSQVPAFTERVNALRQATEGRMTVQVAGPLPPYNFVTLALKWGEPSNAATQ